jgi:hypothetical protein
MQICWQIQRKDEARIVPLALQTTGMSMFTVDMGSETTIAQTDGDGQATQSSSNYSNIHSPHRIWQAQR